MDQKNNRLSGRFIRNNLYLIQTGDSFNFFRSFHDQAKGVNQQVKSAVQALFWFIRVNCTDSKFVQGKGN